MLPTTWLGWIYYPRQSSRRKPHTRLRLERLEDRLAPAVTLTYGGPGTVLSLTDGAGATAVSIAEVSPNDLRIDLNGAFFAAGSTPAAGSLTYQVPGNPTASTFADVNISAGNTISTLVTNLAGETLTLGTIANSQSGVTNVDASAGTVAIVGAVNLPGNASLTAGTAGITNAATGVVTVPSLTLQAVGGIGTSAAPLATVAGTLSFQNTTTGDVVIGNTGSVSALGLNFAPGGQIVLTNTSSATVKGLNSADGTIDVHTTGDLTVSAAVNAGAGSINLFAGGAGSLLSVGSTVTSIGSNPIVLTADRMDLQAAVTQSGTGQVVLQPFSAGQPIDLGSALDPAGSLNLSNNEVGQLHAAGLVQIGNGGAGALTLTASVAAASVGSLSLASGDVIGSNPASATLTTANLALSAVNGIGAAAAPLQTVVSHLVARTTTFFATGIFITNAGTLTIGFMGDPFQSVGVQGSGALVLTNAGTINITNSGEMVLTGGGTIDLTTTAGDIVTGGNQQAVGIGGNSGLATLNAAGNLRFGSNGQTGSISGGGPLVLKAGGDIIVDEGSSVEGFGPSHGVTATAGGNITLQATTIQGASIFSAFGGGDVDLTTGPGGVFTLNSGAGGEVNSGVGVGFGTGNLTIRADHMVINGSISTSSTTAGIVTLAQAGTTALNIDLGTNPSPGRLGLSQNDLDQVTAGILRIGRLDNPGNILVSAAITQPATVGTALSLLAGGGVTENTGATLTAANLAVQSGRGVFLDQANNVSTALAAAISGLNQDFVFVQGLNHPLTVGSADGVNGVTTNDGHLGLATTAADLTINQNLSSGFNNLDLLADGNGSAFTNNAVITTGGQLTIIADRMILDGSAGSALVGVNGPNVILEPFDRTRLVDLGSTTDTASALELSDAELATVSGASAIVIGQAGSIVVTAPITVTTPHAFVVVLGSNSSITDTAAGTLTVNDLDLETFGAVALTGNNHVSGTLAGRVQTANQSFTFTNAQPMTIDNAGGILGITTINGDIVISADDMTITQAINAGDHDVTLRPLTVGRPVDLGGAGAGTRLALDNSELNLVTAGRLRVGGTGVGAITVTTAIAPANAGTLILENGSTVTQNAAATIKIPSLTIIAVGPVVLDQANDVTTGVLAALVTGAATGFTFTDANDLAVAIAGGTALSTNGGAVLLSTLSGNLTISNDVSAGAASVTMNAGGANHLLTNVANITGNLATFSADRMSLGGTVNVGNGAANIVTLQPTSAGQPINFDNTAGDPNGELRLSNAELATITAGILRVGNAALTGAMAFQSDIAAPATWSTLSLSTGGDIGDFPGSLQVANLAVHGGRVGLGNPKTTIAQLAGSGTRGFFLANSASLTVGTVDGVSGLVGPRIDLQLAPGSSGLLTVNQPISAIQLGPQPPGLSLVANDMAINAALTAPAGGTVELAANAMHNIELGGASGPALGLTQVELDRVNADTLNITTTSGNISFTAPIDANSHYRNLLLDASAIFGRGGVTADITVPNLRLTDAQSIGTPAEPLRMSVDTLEANKGSFFFANFFLSEADSVTLAGSGLDAGVGTVALLSGTFHLSAGATIDHFSSVTVAGPSAALDIGSLNAFVDTLTLTNGTITGTTGVLTALTAFDVRSGTISASLGDLGAGIGMTKSTNGTVVLSGTNTFTGPTTVNGGILIVNGSLASRVTSNSGGTLAGGGAVGPFTGTGGVLSPGTAPNSAGILTSGNAALSAGLTFTAELLGTDVTQYDSLHSTGTVDLANATLNLIFGSAFPTTLQAGASLTLVHAPGGLSGIFAGLPNGALITQTIGGQTVTFDIHYTPTDAVLTTSPGINVAGSTTGQSPVVQVFNTDGSLRFTLTAFNPAFTGGVTTTVGDVTGDGVPDIVVGAGPGGGPDVAVFSGVDGTRLYSFFAFNINFTGGVVVAVGDVNDDSFGDIIAGAGEGGGPNVAVFSGKDHTLQLDNWMAFDVGFTGGVTVAAADVNGDHFADVIVGAGPGGGPGVVVFDGQHGTQLSAFFAYDSAFAGGVSVAGGDVRRTGTAQVITGPGSGLGPVVRELDPLTGTHLADFLAYPADVTTGVRVGLGRNAANNQLVILTGQGYHAAAFDEGFDGLTFQRVDQFFAFAGA